MDEQPTLVSQTRSSSTAIASAARALVARSSSAARCGLPIGCVPRVLPRTAATAGALRGIPGTHRRRPTIAGVCRMSSASRASYPGAARTPTPGCGGSSYRSRPAASRAAAPSRKARGPRLEDRRPQLPLTGQRPGGGRQALVDRSAATDVHDVAPGPRTRDPDVVQLASGHHAARSAAMRACPPHRVGHHRTSVATPTGSIAGSARLRARCGGPRTSYVRAIATDRMTSAPAQGQTGTPGRWSR